MVNCVGQPPSAGTSQRLLRPLMFEMKATVLPSGDQVLPPMPRVMYSFSMVRFFSTCAFGLLEICFGSVMAWGAGSTCDRTVVTILTTITKSRKARMRPRFGTQVDEKAEFSTGLGCPICAQGDC